MRRKYDEQLKLLNDSLLEMGMKVEYAIKYTSIAISRADMDKAHQVVDGESDLFEKERTIEALCLKLLMQQQPVASDLRFISSALKMITDLRRIGEEAANICTILLEAEDHTAFQNVEHLPLMANAAISMVSGAVDAYVNRNLTLARNVVQTDEIIDDLFAIIRKELITFIHDEPEKGEQAIDVLMIAKYLEKIGDHSQNVAEWVEFAITGEYQGGRLE